MKWFTMLCLVFAFCSKKTPTNECETWEYQEECIPKSAAVYCPPNPPNTGKICGDDLKAARNGQSTIELDNADVKIIRHYIRKVR